MQVSTKAFVIATVKYAEADLIVSCFTEKYGLKTYLLRGILKSKKGKLRPALFQPLTLLQLEAIHKDKGTLERILEAKVVQPYQTLQTQVVKSSLLLFLSEILKSTVKEEEAHLQLFRFVEASLYWLDEHEEVANFHLLFLLKLSEYLGFYPDFSKNGDFFNLQEGIFQVSPFGNFCETGSMVTTLKAMHGISYNALESLNVPKNIRLQTLELLLTYYRLHVHGFAPPKSLPVFQQLFH